MRVIQLHKIQCLHIGIKGDDKTDEVAKTIAQDESALKPFTDYYEQFRAHCNIETRFAMKEIRLLKGKQYFELYHSAH